MPEFKEGARVACSGGLLHLSEKVGLVKGDQGTLVRRHLCSAATQWYVLFDKPLVRTEYWEVEDWLEGAYYMSESELELLVEQDADALFT